MLKIVVFTTLFYFLLGVKAKQQPSGRKSRLWKSPRIVTSLDGVLYPATVYCYAMGYPRVYMQLMYSSTCTCFTWGGKKASPCQTWATKMPALSFWRRKRRGWDTRYTVWTGVHRSILQLRLLATYVHSGHVKDQDQQQNSRSFNCCFPTPLPKNVSLKRCN